LCLAMAEEGPRPSDDSSESECEVLAPASRVKGRRVRVPLPPPKKIHRFKGRIIQLHVDDDQEEASSIFAKARHQDLIADGGAMQVGLDLEWKPDRGCADNPVALIQLATYDAAVLLRTTGATALPSWVVELFNDPDIFKVVFDFDFADRSKLRRSFGWDMPENAASSFVDIAALAKQVGGMPRSMKAVAAHLDIFMEKERTVGCSNWAAPKLTPEQAQYAADDAFYSLMLGGLTVEAAGEKELAISSRAQFVAVAKKYRAAMAAHSAFIDNSDKYDAFFSLRTAVIDALKEMGGYVATKANKLGGCREIKRLLKTFNFLRLNRQFFARNEDAIVTFITAGELHVRLRQEADGEAEEQDDKAFLERCLATIARVGVGEWVPAKAHFPSVQSSRLEKLVAGLTHVETAWSGDEGIMLKLDRHPGATESEDALVGPAVDLVVSGSGCTREQARTMLGEDEKAQTAISGLGRHAAGSVGEAQLVRSLNARARLLADASNLRKTVASVALADIVSALEVDKGYKAALNRMIASTIDPSLKQRGRKASSKVTQDPADLVAGALAAVAKRLGGEPPTKVARTG